MAGEVGMRRKSGFATCRAGACALLAVIASGCATNENIRAAILEVNQEFKTQYEEILAERGTRGFNVVPGEAFAGVRKSLMDLGMRLEAQDADLGYLNFAAAAPTPLNDAEWKAVAQADLGMMQRIAARHIGLPAYFIGFEPEGLEIVINATVLPLLGRTEVSLTMRMRQVKPPPSGLPRREYAPPTGVRMGLDKIWRQIESELGVRARRP
jgi:hypothetical protein